MATQTLDLDAINSLLADTRTRGAYERDIRAFFESGDLAVDFSQKYPAKDSGSLRNSITGNCKKIQAENTVKGNATPTWNVVLTGSDEDKRVILINMDTYHLLNQQDEQ